MKNEEYGQLVNDGNYPKQVKVELGEVFKDERGEIVNILAANINSASFITSKAGCERANHYHQNCFHFTYILEGSIEYSERDIDGNNIETFIFNAGEMFFSAPYKVHRMKFLTDCKMITFNKSVKNHENYENDVVRVKF